MIAYVNASPLIFLSKLGQLSLLKNLFAEVWTTTMVKAEVIQDQTAIEHVALKNGFEEFIKVAKPINIALIDQISNMQRIHLGEASLIALALERLKEQKNILLIDDRVARQIARSLNLSVTGTAGIILRATKFKLLKKKEGFHLFKSLVTNTDYRISINLFLEVQSWFENLD